MFRIFTPLAAIMAIALVTADADAQYPRSYGNYGRSYAPVPSGPVYHAPSVHYDRVFHPEYSHWTPSRGYHTHGHYHVVPHYTPGHFDYQHGNVIVPNPRYHYPH